MASTDVVTQLSAHTKDRPGSNGGNPSSSRLLSKLARSPTTAGRSHRATSSVNSTGSDTVADQLPAAAATTTAAATAPAATPASHSQRNQPRPNLSRNTSAPIAPPTLNLPREASLPRTNSDGAGQGITQSSAKLLEVSAASLRPPGSSSSKMSIPTGLENVSAPQIPPILQGTNLLYQQFCDISNKRIATLDYLRKSHEGKMFWFNTVQFTKNDISRLPSYTPNRLGRRATSFLLLGLSIPAVLEVHPQPHPSNTPAVNSGIAMEFLRSLNILFTEFESYQQLHPADGSHVSSLARARIPQMFKRAATTGRPRKSSGAPNSDYSTPSQISPPAMPDLPHHGSNPSIDTSNTSQTLSSTASTLVGVSPASAIPPAGFSTTSSFPAPGPPDALNSTLLPNEGPYTHLLTPPLPFTPDFYAVFATLCDVLIDVYRRLMQIVNGPTACTALVGESFSKTDGRIRKVMVAGIVRDFENVARENTKKELMGVQKVVLGGLMGT